MIGSCPWKSFECDVSENEVRMWHEVMRNNNTARFSRLDHNIYVTDNDA